MKRKGYLHLRVTLMLRAVVTATVITALAGLLLRGLGDQQSISEIYYRVARDLFGRTSAEAEAFFYQRLLPNWGAILACIFSLCLLGSFYRSVGRVARWFDGIQKAAYSMREDIGQAVSLPAELAEVEADLNRVRLDVLDKQREAAEGARRSKELVTYLAHDLKTPLTSVVGYLNLLHDRPELEEEQRAAYTGIALEKARRLEMLTHEFFDINRLDLDSIERTGGKLNLSVLLEQLADEFWPIFEQSGLVLHPAISQELYVWGDAEKLARVFDNLLRNAVSYSVSGGAVGLRAFRQGGEVVITVDNEGLEIPEKELSNIFQQFYRLDAARSTGTGGAGLGLAIAREIVERHRGSIRAESTGRRSTFTVILPAR